MHLKFQIDFDYQIKEFELQKNLICLIFCCQLFKRVCLRIVKLWQWRKKCMVVSTSRPQLHNGFKVSWKLCLNLWSRKWLRPTRSLVSNLIPSGLSILKMLLGLGRINFKMDFLIASQSVDIRYLEQKSRSISAFTVRRLINFLVISNS